MSLPHFTTDHGIGFPRSMRTCYDPRVETALVRRWPNRFEAVVVHDNLLSSLDFRPTILELVGEQPSNNLDGRSFAPVLTGGKYDSREQVFLELT